MFQPLDLLDDFATLCELCMDQLAHQNWLDAYLIAAGANQIVEDYLHPDPLAWNRVGRHVADLPSIGRMLATLHRVSDRAVFELDVATNKRWVRWQRDWTAHVVDPLAARLTGVDVRLPMDIATALATDAQSAPARLRRALVRLPSCFQSFDQQLTDVERLVGGFTTRFPDTAQPLTVVGVRSSGSYLAPLGAAFLATAGYIDVIQLTVRPGRRLHRDERARLHHRIVAARNRGGLAVVLDDPPASGRALALVGDSLRALGMPAANIVLLVAVFGASQDLPDVLSDYQSIVLPWPEWAIHEQLTPAAVLESLSNLLRPEGEVTSVQRLPMADRSWQRSHIRAHFSVHLRSPSHAEEQQRDVYIEGVGLGYFGRHALAIADRLTDCVPRVYGLRRGLLFREWLPSTASLADVKRTTEVGQQFVADGIATYVDRRMRVLPLARDKSLQLRGRDPVWEVAGYIVERSFGHRTARPLRPLIQAAVRHLLHVRQPAIVDGATERQRWFFRHTPPRVVKVGYAERDFSNLDMVCCDPVYDLAGANDSSRSTDFGFALRTAFERHTGVPVDAERWLLYQLVQHEAGLRTHADQLLAARAASGRAVRAYFAERLFAVDVHDSAGSGNGPLCAIDIDGVLETEDLGFLAPTPGAAIGMRALTRHGYRPVVVTGRSLDEVQERCGAYGLTGGVAEYGAVVYDHVRQKVIDVITDAALADLERVRAALGELKVVELDSRYRRAVRAYGLNARYTSRALAPELASAVLARAGVEGRVKIIQGQDQTDFMSEGINKGTGLQALIEAFYAADSDSSRVVALAIGDTGSDMPMLALAEHAFAPANADVSLRGAGIRITSGAYQLGFIEAASCLLHHAPGACKICRVPKLPSRTRLLFTLLGAQDRRRWGKLVPMAELALGLVFQGLRATPWAKRKVPIASPRNI